MQKLTSVENMTIRFTDTMSIKHRVQLIHTARAKFIREVITVSNAVTQLRQVPNTLTTAASELALCDNRHMKLHHHNSFLNEFSKISFADYL